MRLYVYPDDPDYDNETRFLFKGITVICDSSKESITFCPLHDEDKVLFEAVKKALIDYVLPF